MKIISLFVVITLYLSPAYSAEERQIELQDGIEVPVNYYPAEDGDKAVIWLPSEFGLSPRQAVTAEALAQQGIEVWMPDLHSAWFLPIGRYSFKDIDSSDISEIIQQIQTQSGKTLFLIAPGRTAAKGLEALHQWQESGMKENQFGGAILFHPKLYAATPQGGEEAQFLPVVAVTNLPVYLLQPENSAHYWRAKKVQQALQEAGSPVFLHLLQNVSDGFYARMDFSDTEETMTVRLPRMIETATEMLATVEVELKAEPIKTVDVPKQKPDGNGSTLLKPYAGGGETPPLSLPSLDGELIDLNDYRGKVVVLNFWATWCPPCVKELPSLDRLKSRTEKFGVTVLSVDVGETEKEIREFLSDKPITFPVLLDPDAKVFKAWNSYAFPTTFVLDRNHNIRFAVFGAFEWDSEEVLDTIDALLKE